MALFAELVKALLRWIDSRLPRPIQQTSRTIVSNISQIATTLVETFPQLKRFARVPKLIVRNPSAGKEEYPLLQDRFILGRDRRVSDIIVDNPLVSKEHLSIQRKNSLPNKPFVINDRGSQHGIYQGNKKIDREFVLTHGDVLTLGKPEFANSVRIKFLNPPPLHISAALCSGRAIILIPILFLVLSGLAWLICPPVNPLPILERKPSIIYASNFTPLYKRSNLVYKEAKNLSEFPALLSQAVIASEDSRYYWHQGIDILGVTRAIFINFKRNKFSEGASTLTQQLARTLFDSYVGGQQLNLLRKIKEAGIALKLETQYSKDVILLYYLDNIYLGENVFGFKDAAKVYFGKSVNKLELSEIATLVAMLPAPNGFDLCRNRSDASHKELVDRRNRVINLLLASKKITSEQADSAKIYPIQAAPSFCQYVNTRIAPYFADRVNQELQILLGEGAKRGNFFIQTSLSLEMQKQAERALAKIINTEGISKGFSQGAITTIDPKTGRILALVGGVDYQRRQFNLVTQAQRQPGSTFKVFAYTTALEQGIRPEKTYSCDKLDWEGEQEPFKPCEHTKKKSLDMYESIALSENVIALRIARDVGLDNVVKIARKMGITSKLTAIVNGEEKVVPRLILGHSEVNLLELSRAYAVLANEGVKTRPHAIKRIFDSSSCKDIENVNSCRVIYSDNTETETRVLKPEVARTMTKLLTGVVKDGTGNKANLPGVQVAGKTGTTNRARDLWFVGYMPNQFVTGVWLGNDENTPTDGTSALAAQVWGDYMSRFVP
ncbi:MAG: transglycosylase domain-containing protein [Nostoc sp. EkiNYC01]|nr:transglycosylase domain-containing protein [Nostoc sp. EkiNYC01]